ncbi:MAG TPA: hypothetical protein VN151_01220 [Terracidiphilus sp.]|nr:hypothetical protein [Terracidiphilus sp.]
MAASLSLLLTFPVAALRVKIAPDEAKAEGFGGSKVEANNKVWRDFYPQPGGLGPISLISAALVARRHPVCVAPRSLT